MAKKKKSSSNGAIGFEDTLWKATGKLRGKMDFAEYKHVVLGLLFLKCISDKFEQRRSDLLLKFNEEEMVQEELDKELELRDYYIAGNVFWVPKEARWIKLQEISKKLGIGTLVDNAMDLTECENNSLKGVLPKIYKILNLPKLDWNSSEFCKDLPVTISTSRKVSEIMAEISLINPTIKIPTAYSDYV